MIQTVVHVSMIIENHERVNLLGERLNMLSMDEINTRKEG